MIENIENEGKERVIREVCLTLQNLMKEENTVHNKEVFKNKVIVANAFLDSPDGYNNAGIDAKELKNPIYTRRRTAFLSILRCEFLEISN